MKGFKWKDDVASSGPSSTKRREPDASRPDDRPREARAANRRHDESTRSLDTLRDEDRSQKRTKVRTMPKREGGAEATTDFVHPDRKRRHEVGAGAGLPTPTIAPAYQEPMIIVNVNDRLGTKAAIPCLASDPVKAFKALVAARIGREPHEIMLKRQGERPFKDQLTLEDYGVSNGVQLDLEVDTGD